MYCVVNFCKRFGDVEIIQQEKMDFECKSEFESPTIIKKVQIGNHKLGSRYFGFFFSRKLHEYQWQSNNILQIVPRVFNIIFEMKLPGNVLAKEIKLKNGFIFF